MKVKHLLPIFSVSMLLSCSKEQAEQSQPKLNEQAVELYGAAGAEVRVGFAKVLAKAIQNAQVRQLIESAAANQFDKDSDVLYQQIKGERIAEGTLDDYVKSMSTEAEYNLFTHAPLLTMYVPALRKSYTKTAVSSEVPWVAVRNAEDKLIAFNASGESKELDANVLPDAPVAVVKENERVVFENQAKSQAKKGDFLFESGGNKFYFADNEFNPATAKQHNTAQGQTQARFIQYRTMDPVVSTAYDNSLTCNNCPQRDWIYYGIYPVGGQNEGSLNIKYSEAITSVQFENTNVFSTVGGWDEGNYELYVSIFFSGSATGPLSSMLKVISVNPNDMFEFDANGLPINNWTYTPANLYTIVPWDMKAYGNKWAFKVEEYDPSINRTLTTTNSSTYGTNFKLTTGADIKVVKVGAEFGVTSTSSSSNSYTYQTTDTNDILGGAILTWTDPVMVSKGKWFFIPIANMGTITTGTVRIGVETVRTMP